MNNNFKTIMLCVITSLILAVIFTILITTIPYFIVYGLDFSKISFDIMDIRGGIVLFIIILITMLYKIYLGD